jgi:NADPH:quinone reductase-like Zn-dependent oxidoreductase
MYCYEFSDAISLRSLRLTERPDPVPGPHDIVIRMRAAALNFRDLAMERGRYHIGVSPPLVPLSDGAGEIIETGNAVTRFQVGDLVCPMYLPDWHDGPLRANVGRRRLGGPTDGVLTERMCVHEEEAVRAPRHLDAAEATALPVVAPTAWRSLHCLGSLRPGETLLVQGSGAISTTALQLGKASGASVVVVLRDERHAEALKTLGADFVVHSSGTSDWPQAVRNVTGGAGADVAVNVAGGKTLTSTVAATKLGGMVHLVGFASDSVAELDLFEAIRHGTTFHTATAGNREDFEAFVRVAELHDIRPVIAKVFALEGLRDARGLDQIRDAFAHLASGGHLGKIVLSF